MGSPHRAAVGEIRSVSGCAGGATGPLNGAALLAEAPGARALAAGAPEYPAALGDLTDAPAVIWTRGARLPARSRAVAIVGSRAASAYGLAFAERLARDLAALGLTVVSGFARGIDRAAHRGALTGGGATVAVVPCGLDRIERGDAPELAASIDARGAWVSEIASGPPFGRGAFVRRNRLIAALAAATVVVEAAERSGALSTATVARRLGRALLATPGDVDRPTALGTLALLRAGARPCGGAGDVLAAAPELAAPPDDAPPEARLAAALREDPESPDVLAVRAGLALPLVLATLGPLEWAGVARRAPGGRWRRGGAGA